MKNLECINVNNGWKWLNSLENKLEKERWNKKENNSGRKCLWFGVGVELGFKNSVFEGKRINSGLKKRHGVCKVNEERWSVSIRRVIC